MFLLEFRFQMLAYQTSDLFALLIIENHRPLVISFIIIHCSEASSADTDGYPLYYTCNVT